jgi:hypothetical protein
MRCATVLVCVVLAGCATSDDPAEGGFFNGVAGLAGGGYEARIAEREQGLAAAQGRQQALAVELSGLEREHAALSNQIIRQQAALRARGVGLPLGTDQAIQAAAAEPVGADPAARAASLRRAIADSRRLSAQLAMLGS